MTSGYPETGKQVEANEDSLVTGAKGGAVAFLLRISATALNFLNQVILARILGASGIGEVFLVLTVVNISAILAKFGMEGTMMRFIPLYIEKNDKAKLKGTIYFALKFSLLISIIIVSLVLIFTNYISISVFHSKGLLKLLPIAAIAIPVIAIRGIVTGILKAYKDTYKALLPELFILPSIRIGIFLILCLHGSLPLYAIIAFIAGETFAMFLSILFLLAKIKKIGHTELLSENKGILSMSATMLLTGFSMFLFAGADLWIVGMFTSTEAVGIYGIAVKLASLVFFSMLAFETIIPALISSIFVSGNKHELNRIVSESTRWILSLAFPISLILILEGKIILEHVYGMTFGSGYTVLVILSIGQLIKAGSGMVGILLQMTGEHKTYMKITVFWGGVNVALNIVLVPYFGIIGAALSTAFCMSMLNVVSVFTAFNRLSVLTLAKGIKFDVLFAAAVAILYFLCSFSNFNLGYHFLLIGSLIIYSWKSIANDDLPWRLLLAKSRT